MKDRGLFRFLIIFLCFLRRRAEFIQFLGDRFGRERKNAYDQGDQKIGKYVACLIDKAIQRRVLPFGRENAEREPTGQEVHDKSAKSCDRCAERETDLGNFLKSAHIFKDPCKPHGGKRQGIIEQKLRRV